MTFAYRPSLDASDFFLLHDSRGFEGTLESRRQFDADPQESRRIAREIIARRGVIDPAWYVGKEDAGGYFDNPDHEVAADLVPAVSAFAVNHPGKLAHFDKVRSYTEARAPAYTIVSRAWKNAIESLEPGVHQFFPHDLSFASDVIERRFIMRDRARVATGAPVVEVSEVRDQFGWRVGHRAAVNGAPITVEIDRARVAGRHFVRDRDNGAILVSRALAERLLPLLPAGACLVPIAMRGGGQVKKRPAIARPLRDHVSFDETLRASLLVLASPVATTSPAQRNAATRLARARLANASLDQVFAIMSCALRFEGPLLDNKLFEACWRACHQRVATDVLPRARAWAKSRDPLERIAAIRALLRPICDEQEPDAEVLEIVAGYVAERDPRVLVNAHEIVYSTNYPMHLRALLGKHPNAAMLAAFNSVRVEDEARALNGEAPLATEDSNAIAEFAAPIRARRPSPEKGQGRGGALRAVKIRVTPRVKRATA